MKTGSLGLGKSLSPEPIACHAKTASAKRSLKGPWGREWSTAALPGKNQKLVLRFLGSVVSFGCVETGTALLCPGLNPSVVQILLHIWQGYLRFHTDYFL